MNILLWIFQGVVAFLYFTGGAYKVSRFDEVASQMVAIPRAGWAAIGVIEVIGAILLIVPAATKWMPALTPLAATVLTLETLVIGVIYAQHSLKMGAENPLTWAIAMGAMVAFVAYGRYVLEPLS